MKFYQHLLSLFEKHKPGIFLSFLLAIILLIIASIEASLIKTFAYLIVLFSAFLFSEFIYFTGKPAFKEWKIKKPKQELRVVLFVVIVCSLLMVYWFIIADQNAVSQAVSIAALLLRVIFIFPVFLLVYFLGFKKYKPREIGIWGFKYWFVSIPIIILLGGTAYLFFPDGMQFEQQWQSNGIITFIFLGFFTAAIPEEITRTIFQSRLGVVINNKSIAWFIVSLVWAIQHIPAFVFSSEGDYYGATISALGILPIGLLWGYLNERFKSIIPSVIIHGTNLWGLHNIF